MEKHLAAVRRLVACGASPDLFSTALYRFWRDAAGRVHSDEACSAVRLSLRHRRLVPDFFDVVSCDVALLCDCVRFPPSLLRPRADLLAAARVVWEVEDALGVEPSTALERSGLATRIEELVSAPLPPLSAAALVSLREQVFAAGRARVRVLCEGLDRVELRSQLVERSGQGLPALVRVPATTPFDRVPSPARTFFAAVLDAWPPRASAGRRGVFSLLAVPAGIAAEIRVVTANWGLADAVTEFPGVPFEVLETAAALWEPGGTGPFSSLDPAAAVEAARIMLASRPAPSSAL